MVCRVFEGYLIVVLICISVIIPHVENSHWVLDSQNQACSHTVFFHVPVGHTCVFITLDFFFFNLEGFVYGQVFSHCFLSLCPVYLCVSDSQFYMCILSCMKYLL